MTRARAAEPVRFGILQFGTAQWVAEIIRRDGLDTKHGVALTMVTLANNDAGRTALMAGGADVVVSDWLFAASQRRAGTPLCFAPFTNATGGVMVPADSPVRTLADLKGKRLGVAGGPLDKSWFIVQAAAQSGGGIDLAAETQPVYGAPPLLDAKLRQGELDAVLTFWNFTARLEAAGFREAISVAACARTLGLTGSIDLVGFVFHEPWAMQHRAAIDGFLAAAAEAEDRLAHSDTTWQQIRPLMQAPDDALFEALRRRFVAGISHATPAEQQATAARLLDVLTHVPGGQAAAGLSVLPQGLFWPTADEGD